MSLEARKTELLTRGRVGLHPLSTLWRVRFGGRSEGIGAASASQWALLSPSPYFPKKGMGRVGASHTVGGMGWVPAGMRASQASGHDRSSQ